jgi:hypothetical protein
MIPRYIGIPPEFYDSPKCIEMSHATARFYGFIFWMSHRLAAFSSTSPIAAGNWREEADARRLQSIPR